MSLSTEQLNNIRSILLSDRVRFRGDEIVPVVAILEAIQSELRPKPEASDASGLSDA